MTALTPGLYRATVRGVPDTLLIVDQNGMGHHTLLDSCPGDIGVTHTSTGEHITDARPLITLDLGDWHPETIKAFAAKTRSTVSDTSAVKFAQWLADQIEAQTKPRIPEPGLWGVVRSLVRESGGEPLTWVRDTHGVYPWISTAPGWTPRQWADLIDPVLVRDGIS